MLIEFSLSVVPNTDNITRLLTTLRDQTQTFPTNQNEANDVLDDLERDLK